MILAQPLNLPTLVASAASKAGLPTCRMSETGCRRWATNIRPGRHRLEYSCSAAGVEEHMSPGWVVGERPQSK